MFCSQSARSVEITTDWPSGESCTPVISTELKNSSSVSLGLSAACAEASSTTTSRKKNTEFPVVIGAVEKNSRLHGCDKPAQAAMHDGSGSVLLVILSSS